MQHGTHLAIGIAAILLGVLGGEHRAFAAVGPTACDGRVPKAAQALVTRGDMAAKLGSLDIAEQEYRRALAAAPETPAILYRLALLHANSGNEIGGLLYLRAYLEAASASRKPCVPVPVEPVRQVIQDLEAKVEVKASQAFEAAIEAIGATGEEERASIAQDVVVALARSERWRQAESIARQYPLGMTERVALSASAEHGPLKVRMFDLAEKFAGIDPPDSKLTIYAGSVIAAPEVLGPLVIPGMSAEENQARLERDRVEQERRRAERERAERPKWRISCHATRLLALALTEDGGYLERRAGGTIVRSQEMLAAQGLHYGGQCLFGGYNMIDIGHGVQIWDKRGLFRVIGYKPGDIWGKNSSDRPYASQEASGYERDAVASASIRQSAVSACGSDARLRFRWITAAQGALDHPRVRPWVTNTPFVNFAGWVQEVKAKMPAGRAKELAEGGFRLTRALGDLRACGAAGQKWMRGAVMRREILREERYRTSLGGYLVDFPV